jgi:predicted transcriptional regulator
VESAELVFVRPGEGIRRFYMLFSEYLVYGSKEEEKEDGEFREEEIEEEEIEEAQMNEDEEKSEDEEDWEAKRQEWVEYFRHRSRENIIRPTSTMERHVRATIGFWFE